MDRSLALTMAIRERLMEYFKDTCVERMTEDSRLQFSSLPYTGRHNYQRELHQRRNEGELYLGQLPLFLLSKSPDRIIFYDTVWNRSPQLREVKSNLEKFIEQYLGAVKTDHQGGVIYGR